MIETEKRELPPSFVTPIQLWLIQEGGVQFQKVLASKIAECEANFANECLKWNVSKVSGLNDASTGEVPPSAKSNLHLATRYQMALDVLNEMAGPEAEMSHVTLKLPYA